MKHSHVDADANDDSDVDNYIQTSDFDLGSSSDEGISCVQLDGSMSLPARDAVIKRFTEDSNCRIFLKEFESRGRCSQILQYIITCFVMDPWWRGKHKKECIE
ncbi:ATP-dependent helicase rhp16-like [Tripterygium wilfordii]|uniref:ATP-dependent helicase rhp16-like n=1 Tax=Tripterygium wilfordii TaxID=458696 RepID=UPI0018F85880|nr:ATP-dependent helicase rhp16-like [Tripterygium wilfordii]XP_038704168.1 ATP-dependent helicase rhp16-like [Tripterygium wilfordii]XP_038704169.1 ATP-dependent helicase rhp16-like [Tripterygium wilfordii]XP_038704170.1 ATP-dependent helicase rhp16-like [Tripterygium wilfordii]